MPSLLIAVAASGSPLMSALAMLGLGQGPFLVPAGVTVGFLKSLSRLAPYRRAIERLLGVTWPSRRIRLASADLSVGTVPLRRNTSKPAPVASET